MTATSTSEPSLVDVLTALRHSHDRLVAAVTSPTTSV